MAQVKKLSVATVYGKIDLEKLIKAPDQRLAIMTVLGSAVGLKTGTSSYGEWRALQGQFEATNLETGEVSEAAQLFLPDVALTPILVSLSQDNVRNVTFAIKLSAMYVKSNKPGTVPYEYTWEPLLPPDQSDPISQLKAKLLALEAPKTAEPQSAAAPTKTRK